MGGQDDSGAEYLELVTVYVPRSYEEYIVAVPILDEHNIRHLDKNAVLYPSFADGMLAGFSPDIGPIEVQVSAEDAAEAKRLLEDVLRKIRTG